MARTVQEEIRLLRDRVHRVVDTQQVHAVRLSEHQLMLEMLKTTVQVLQTDMVTKDQHVASAALTNTKLDHISERVQGVQRVGYWVAGLIIASVIAALLNLVLNRAALEQRPTTGARPAPTAAPSGEATQPIQRRLRLPLSTLVSPPPPSPLR